MGYFKLRGGYIQRFLCGISICRTVNGCWGQQWYVYEVQVGTMAFSRALFLLLWRLSFGVII